MVLCEEEGGGRVGGGELEVGGQKREAWARGGCVDGAWTVMK